jgi:hypothetical protein
MPRLGDFIFFELVNFWIISYLMAINPIMSFFFPWDF